jgi:hypothetical protein
MYRGYRDRVAFLFVYIRESHPTDGWQMPSNEKDGVLFEQPRTIRRRQEAATACCAKLKLSMTCVVDSIDNRVDDAYAAWPERMFVVTADGRIAYAGQLGPWGFKPAEVQEWLRKNVGKPTGTK